MVDNRISGTVKKFPYQHVLVLGDAMIDEYWWATSTRVSPETGKAIGLVEKITHNLGGAANVAHNLTTLGGKAYLATVTGEDSDAGLLLKLLRQRGITPVVVNDPFRTTTKKMRPMIRPEDGTYFGGERYDFETARPLTEETSRLFVEKILDTIKKEEIKAIAISDYGKGVLRSAKRDCSLIAAIAKETNIPIIVDPKPPFATYEGGTIITPNRKEAQGYTQVLLDDTHFSESALYAASGALRTRLKVPNILITCGGKGIYFDDQEKQNLLPAHAIEVADPCGAGDTVLATLALSIASGLPLEEAAVLANLGGSLAVQKKGTATIDAKELEEILDENFID